MFHTVWHKTTIFGMMIYRCGIATRRLRGYRTPIECSERHSQNSPILLIHAHAYYAELPKLGWEYLWGRALVCKTICTYHTLWYSCTLLWGNLHVNLLFFVHLYY